MKNDDSFTRIKQIVSLNESLQVKQKLGQDKALCRKFFSTLNYCLKSVKPSSREILLNSYFQRDYKFWWIDKYCKSSYYRMRTRAVHCFVNLFDTIYENFSYFSRNIIRASK